MKSRVLLKLSGEQLAGKYHSGIDVELGAWLAGQVGALVEAGHQIIVMVGGGNYARGAQLSAAKGIDRVTADNIGMLATIMNSLALADLFNHAGVESRALSNIKADQVIDQFTHRRAESTLSKRRVVIVAGGIGRPYLTTDTAAVSLALETSCQLVLKATKVDGVYDKDPASHDDAKKFETISFQQAVENQAVRVMDKAALGLAMEHDLPIVVFDALVEDNLVKAASGQAVGTRIG